MVGMTRVTALVLGFGLGLVTLGSVVAAVLPPPPETDLDVVVEIAAEPATEGTPVTSPAPSGEVVVVPHQPIEVDDDDPDDDDHDDRDDPADTGDDD